MIDHPVEGDPGHPYGSAPWVTRRDEQIEQIKQQQTPPETPETRPKLPLAELVQIGTDDGADYCDGDCSGYHGAIFESGVLTLDYTADEFSQHASARAQFVEVSALVAAIQKMTIAMRGTVVIMQDATEIIRSLSDALDVDDLIPYEPEGGPDE